MFVKLKRAAVYKGRKYAAGDIIEVGNDLGNRMILAGQAERSNKADFEKQKGIELQPKMKKADIIEAIKAAD